MKIECSISNHDEYFQSIWVEKKSNKDKCNNQTQKTKSFIVSNRKKHKKVEHYPPRNNNPNKTQNNAKHKTLQININSHT